MRLGRLGHDPNAAPPKVGFHGKPGRVERQELKEEQAKGPVLRLRPMNEHAPIKVPSRNAKATEMDHDWPVVVRAILDRMQWSSTVMAGHVDVSGATVRNWTLGRCLPSKKVDQRIVDLYRKHVGELP